MSNFNAPPYTLTDGTTADATQVMANFDQIISNGNANCAANGANSDITSLSGLTTPLPIAEGGTGATSASAALTNLGAMPATTVAALLNTLTASNSATLFDTTSLTTTYKSYRFIFINLIPVTNGVDLYMRVSTNGGSSYDSGGNYNTAILEFIPTAVAQTGGNAQGAFTLDMPGQTIGSSAANNGLSGELMFFTPAAAAGFKRAQWNTSHFGVSGSVDAGARGNGIYVGTGNAINAVQFLMSSGNIASGTIEIWGVP